MKNEYSFPVEFRSLVTEPGNLAIPNRVAVVRTDTKLPIGVVSKKYGLLPHADVVNGFRKALKDETTEETFKMTHQGARMHFEVRLPKVTVKIDDKDRMAMRLIVQNSYDGSHKLQIILGAFRLVCSNGMIIGKKMITFDRRHVGEMGLEVERVQKQIYAAIDSYKQTEPILREMAKMKLPNPVEFFQARKLRLPAYLTAIAAEEYDKSNKGTVWDAYNALTYAITHKMKKENQEASIYFGQHAWSAVSALFKN